MELAVLLRTTLNLVDHTRRNGWGVNARGLERHLLRSV